MGELLMIPGPTMLSARVIRAMARQVCSHLSQEFADALSEARDMLKEVLRTRQDVVIAPGSSSLGIEMAIANSVEPGDEVLVVASGYYADRIARMVRRHRGVPVKVEAPLRRGIPVERVAEACDAHPEARALCVVHVETSTGVVNPVRELGCLARRRGLLYIVDAVSSVGGMDVRVDEWGMDYCITGPQKALAAPPGLALLSVSERALEAAEQRREEPFTFYMDVRGWVRATREPLRRYVTHAVLLVLALREALRLVLEEGLEKRFRRHEALAEALRTGLKALGMELFPEEAYAAPTLTAVEVPEGLSSRALVRAVLEEGVRVSAGWGELADRILRVGHMGNVGPEHILRTLGALERALARLGREVSGGVEAAAARLSEFEEDLLRPPDEVPELEA